MTLVGFTQKRFYLPIYHCAVNFFIAFRLAYISHYRYLSLLKREEDVLLKIFNFFWNISPKKFFANVLTF